jgi:hypothetical protein
MKALTNHNTMPTYILQGFQVIVPFQLVREILLTLVEAVRHTIQGGQ